MITQAKAGSVLHPKPSEEPQGPLRKGDWSLFCFNFEPLIDLHAEKGTKKHPTNCYQLNACGYNQHSQQR